MLPTKLTIKQWNNILCILKKENNPSTIFFRRCMKEKLGFTIREQKNWSADWDSIEYVKKYIYLDWFDERKRVLFEMRFSEEISREL